MVEIWKAVPDLVGAYEVSSAGRVRSLDRYVRRGDSGFRLNGRILKDVKVGKGYRQVVIGGRSRTVHRLVLEAFVGPCPPGMECCHTNGDPADNRLENLRWDTPSGNNRDKRRHGTDHNASKTHCPQGHEYDAENTRVRAGGARHCRTCRRDKQRDVMHQKMSTPEGRRELAEKMRDWRHRTGKVTGLHNYGSRTHCKYGHEFTPENTLHRSDGGRRCRECRRVEAEAKNRKTLEQRKRDPEARAKHAAYMREYRNRTRKDH